MLSGRFEFRIWKQRVEFKGDRCYETRRTSVENLIRGAYKLLPILPEHEQDKWTGIWTSDRPEVDPHPSDLFFSSPAAETAQSQRSWAARPEWCAAQIIVPDFVFANWPQVAIDDYDVTCQQMYDCGRDPAIRPQCCGWYGNASLSQSRRLLVAASARSPDSTLIAVDTGTWKPAADPRQTRLDVSQNHYKSLPDQVREFGALIDVEGYGWSGRLKLLFHSQRPVLLQKRPWQEFYFQALVPWHHYIPVSRDLRDLPAALDVLRRDPEKAREIGQNGSRFAAQHLTHFGAIVRWALQLNAGSVPLDQLMERPHLAPARARRIALWIAQFKHLYLFTYMLVISMFTRMVMLA